MKSALKSMFESGFLQLMAIICLLAACALCSSGCRSVMVEEDLSSLFLCCTTHEFLWFGNVKT